MSESSTPTADAAFTTDAARRCQRARIPALGGHANVCTTTDHAMHCLLTECFGREMSPKPFRIIFPKRRLKGLFSTATARADARRLARCCRHLRLPHCNARIIPTQSQPEQQTDAHRSGQLGQAAGLRDAGIRPIVRRLTRNGADSRPGKEWDAFQLDADQYGKRRNAAHPGSRSIPAGSSRPDGADRRGAHAGIWSILEMVSFQRTRAVRKPHTVATARGQTRW